MNSSDKGPCGPAKRADVGYKRPPLEHRFKTGQKPPPRRKKEQKQVSPRDLLWKILKERRRVIREGKAVWITNAELIGRRAFLEAEKGAATVQRLVTQLLLRTERKREDDAPEIITIPDGHPFGNGCVAGTAWVKTPPPD